MNAETIIQKMKQKHGFEEVTLTVCREKICSFEETNYMFKGRKNGKPVEGTVLYSIEHRHYVVTENPNTSGYWI